MSNAVASAPKVAVRQAKASQLPKKEMDSRSVPPTQKSSMELPPLEDPIDREPDIQIIDNALEMAEAEAIAFNEEPMIILIHREAHNNKFSPKTTDLICVNGRKAEMLFRNGFIQVGYLPRGIAFTTKRKYVEAIALSKVNHINTRIEEKDSEQPRNFVDPVTLATCAFSVLQDKNPKGAYWLAELLNRN